MDSPAWPPVVSSTRIGNTRVVTSYPVVSSTPTVAPPSTNTPTEKANLLNDPNTAFGYQEFIHDRTHFQGLHRGDCMYCHAVQSNNGESYGSQEMSQESSQASGADMFRGTSSSANTSYTTINSYQYELCRSKAEEEELDHLIRKINEAPPQAAAVMWDLVNVRELLLWHTKRATRDIKPLKAHIADLKSAFGIGSGFLTRASQGLDPTSNAFGEPAWQDWVPPTGISVRRNESLHLRCQILLREEEILKAEEAMLLMMWESRFQFSVSEGYAAPDRKGHFDEFIRNQPKKPGGRMCK